MDFHVQCTCRCISTRVVCILQYHDMSIHACRDQYQVQEWEPALEQVGDTVPSYRIEALARDCSFFRMRRSTTRDRSLRSSAAVGTSMLALFVVLIIIYKNNNYY